MASNAWRALPERMFRGLAAAALLGGAVCGAASARTGERVRLIAERTSVAPGGSFTLAVELQTQPGWHTYWLNPGDSGLAPTLRWRLPEGVRLTRVSYPVPDRFEEEGIVSLGYADHVWLLADVALSPAVRPADLEVGLSVDWMVCREVCLPVTSDAAVRVTVAAEDAEPVADAHAAEFKRWRERLPEPAAGWTVQAQTERRGLRLRIQPPPGSAPAPATWSGAQVYVTRRGAINLQDEQRWRRTGAAWEALLSAGPEPFKPGDVMEGVLVFPAAGAGRARPQAWGVTAAVTGNLF